jgi:hypothetical protein
LSYITYPRFAFRTLNPIKPAHPMVKSANCDY